MRKVRLSHAHMCNQSNTLNCEMLFIIIKKNGTTKHAHETRREIIKYIKQHVENQPSEACCEVILIYFESQIALLYFICIQFLLLKQKTVVKGHYPSPVNSVLELLPILHLRNTWWINR